MADFDEQKPRKRRFPELDTWLKQIESIEPSVEELATAEQALDEAIDLALGGRPSQIIRPFLSAALVAPNSSHSPAESTPPALGTLDKLHLVRFLLPRLIWYILRPLLEGYLSRMALCPVAIKVIQLPPGSDGASHGSLQAGGSLKLVTCSLANPSAWSRPTTFLTTKPAAAFLEMDYPTSAPDAPQPVVLRMVFSGQGPSEKTTYRIPVILSVVPTGPTNWPPSFPVDTVIEDSNWREDTLSKYLHFCLRLSQQWAKLLVAHGSNVESVDLPATIELVASAASRERLEQLTHIVHEALLLDGGCSDSFVVWLLTPDSSGSTLNVVAGTEPYPDPGKASVAIGPPTDPANWGIGGRSYRRRRQIVSRHAATDRRVRYGSIERAKEVVATPIVVGHPGDEALSTAPAYHSVLYPQKTRDIGVLYVATRDEKFLLRHHVLFLRHFAQLCAEWIERADVGSHTAQTIRTDLCWDSTVPDTDTFDKVLNLVDPDYSWDQGKTLSWIQGLCQDYAAVKSYGSGAGCVPISILLFRIDQDHILTAHFVSDRVLAAVVDQTKAFIETEIAIASGERVMHMSDRVDSYRRYIVAFLPGRSLRQAGDIAKRLQFSYSIRAMRDVSDHFWRHIRHSISISFCTMNVQTLLRDGGFVTVHSHRQGTDFIENLLGQLSDAIEQKSPWQAKDPKPVVIQVDLLPEHKVTQIWPVPLTEAVPDNNIEASEGTTKA